MQTFHLSWYQELQLTLHSLSIMPRARKHSRKHSSSVKGCPLYGSSIIQTGKMPLLRYKLQSRQNPFSCLIALMELRLNKVLFLFISLNNRHLLLASSALSSRKIVLELSATQSVPNCMLQNSCTRSRSRPLSQMHLLCQGNLQRKRV